MTEIVAIFGTRPERIKVEPVLRAFRNKDKALILQTGQHIELLDSLGKSGNDIKHRFLNIALRGLGLADALGQMVSGIARELDGLRPRLVLVQGDTSSALAGAIAARLSGLPVGHVEAGLRSFDDTSPWPEEMNRRLIGQIAGLHFAPTEASRRNLLQEGVPENTIHVTGNTAVDVVHQRMHELGIERRECDRQRGSIVVTLHRRESHGAIRLAALRRLMSFLEAHSEYQVRLFSHPNPDVVADLQKSGIEQHSRVTIREPVPHHELLQEVAASSFVVSDSGGIQEEAPSLGRTVFIARDETERPEAVEAGLNFLSGGGLENFEQQFGQWVGSSTREIENPYGDGQAGRRIAEICEGFLRDETA